MEERYLAYSVACAPSERLYMSWPRSADGEDKEPSELVSGLLGIFPSLRPLRDLPDEYFANSREAAFSRMASRFTGTDGASGALRKLFENDEAYRGRVEALERASGNREEQLKDLALARGLFGRASFFVPHPGGDLLPVPVPIFLPVRLKRQRAPYCRGGRAPVRYPDALSV